jgi:hypothetical protein
MLNSGKKPQKTPLVVAVFACQPNWLWWLKKLMI